MGLVEIGPTLEDERVFYWNAAWYAREAGVELKFKQEDKPSDADILEAYERVTAAPDPVDDRESLLTELKNTISENEIGALELFTWNEIDGVDE